MDGVIRTSTRGWLAELARAYRERVRIIIIDDANVGIDPSSDTLLDMGLKAGLSREDWMGVLLALGMTVFGAILIILAILDPEPTSKLGLLVASGAILVLSGGLTAIYILTKLKPPNIRASKAGIEIEWT